MPNLLFQKHPETQSQKAIQKLWEGLELLRDGKTIQKSLSDSKSIKMIVELPRKI